MFLGAVLRRRRVREALTGYAFLLPAVGLFALMGIYTIGYGLANRARHRCRQSHAQSFDLRHARPPAR